MATTETTDLLPKLYDCANKCGQKIRLQKIGEKENGKAIWKSWDETGTIMHDCPNDKSKKSSSSSTGGAAGSKRQVELLESIDKTMREILAELKRQGMR